LEIRFELLAKQTFWLQLLEIPMGSATRESVPIHARQFGSVVSSLDAVVAWDKTGGQIDKVR
jgi:hypothetical protein